MGVDARQMENKTTKRAVLIFFLCLFCACSEIGEKDKSGAGRKALPDQVISNFTIVETKEGKLRWELDAQRAEIYKRENIIYNLKIKFYNDQEEIISTLSADEGRIDSPGDAIKDIFVKGNVVVVSEEEKMTLTTESLKWDSNLGKITTEDFVRQETEDAVITGYGLEADSELSKVVLKRDVKVIQKIKEE